MIIGSSISHYRNVEKLGEGGRLMISSNRSAVKLSVLVVVSLLLQVAPAQGQDFVWAQQMGGTGNEYPAGIAVDDSGNVYTTGAFQGTADLDPGAGIFNLTAAGSIAPDIFVSKLDSAGNFVWARQMGGTGYGNPTGIAVDDSSNVYTTGVFSGTVDFDPGAGIFNLTSAGSIHRDIFVSKLDSAGNFVWDRQMGGTSNKEPAGIAVDGSGNVYTTGVFSGTGDFDPGAGIFNLTSAGSIAPDIFVSKLDSAGTFVWTRQMGGTGYEYPAGIAVDGSGNVYTTGVFSGTVDFDPGPGVFTRTSAGRDDVFVSKLDGGPPLPAISEGGIVLATLLPTVTTVSPLSIISVFGQNFSTEAILFPNLDGQGKLDTILGGTCLMMNDEVLPVFAITPGQINAQASAAQVLGPASFTVVTDCDTPSPLLSETVTLSGVFPTPRALTSDVETATVEEATPGFFLFPPRAVDGFIAARFNATPGQPPVPVAPENSFPNDSFGPSRPAAPGDIILLYGTGWGETTAALGTGELASGAAELLPEANPIVTFGGIPMASEDVLYVGVTPTTAGLYQLAIRVPAMALPGDNQVELTVYGKSTPLGPVIPVAAP